MAQQHDGQDGAGGPNGTGSQGADGNGGDAGNGHHTFSGSGFGTLVVRFNEATLQTPAVASTRAYLRNGLPSLYQDGDFGMRFVGALEELLDPIVAVLDALPPHFYPNLAPPGILGLLAAGLGVGLDQPRGIKPQREWGRPAPAAGRPRG